MPDLFDFDDGGPTRPKLPERLFYGLFPDDETAIRVDQWTQAFFSAHRLRGPQLKAERLHVSLHHIGDYKRLPSKIVYAAKQVGKRVSVRPFEVTFRSIKTFEGAPSAGGRSRQRPLVLLGESEGLFELYRVIGDAMEKNGLRATEYFTPHMVLSYGAAAVPLQEIDPIRFIVDEFVLIHSMRGLTQYEMIGRWPLYH
jgi:RNA 2',3'-cyclic 3'-phosphodiesterase